MGTNECSQPASKSSWDSQDFGDNSMVLKMAHFRKSTGPQWVKLPRQHLYIETDPFHRTNKGQDMGFDSLSPARPYELIIFDWTWIDDPDDPLVMILKSHQGWY